MLTNIVCVRTCTVWVSQLVRIDSSEPYHNHCPTARSARGDRRLAFHPYEKQYSSALSFLLVVLTAIKILF